MVIENQLRDIPLSSWTLSIVENRCSTIHQNSNFNATPYNVLFSKSMLLFKKKNAKFKMSNVNGITKILTDVKVIKMRNIKLNAFFFCSILVDEDILLFIALDGLSYPALSWTFMLFMQYVHNSQYDKMCVIVYHKAKKHMCILKFLVSSSIRPRWRGRYFRDRMVVRFIFD